MPLQWLLGLQLQPQLAMLLSNSSKLNDITPLPSSLRYLQPAYMTIKGYKKCCCHSNICDKVMYSFFPTISSLTSTLQSYELTYRHTYFQSVAIAAIMESAAEW